MFIKFYSSPSSLASISSSSELICGRSSPYSCPSTFINPITNPLTNNSYKYHRQLKLFHSNNEFVEDIIQGDFLGDEDNFGFNQVDGHEYGEDLSQINSDKEEMDASEDEDE